MPHLIVVSLHSDAGGLQHWMDKHSDNPSIWNCQTPNFIPEHGDNHLDKPSTHTVSGHTHTQRQDKEALKTFIAPMEESLPREAAVCLSSHCSTLSCQLYLRPVLTSPPVNASYVRGHIIQCIPSGEGPHLTVPAYQIQRTRGKSKSLGFMGPVF